MKHYKELLSAGIIVAVTALVFVGAGFAVHRSMTDAHSNIRLARKAFRSAFSPIAQSPEPLEANAMEPAAWLHQQTLVKQAEMAEQECLKQRQSASEESLTDYLTKKNLINDFQSRTVVAAVYGITDYRGTATQNAQLLRLLMRDETAGEPCTKTQDSSSLVLK